MRNPQTKLTLWGLMLVAVVLIGCQSNQTTNPNSQLEEPAANQTPPVPPPPPKGAFLGGISPDILENISHLPVMAPAYLPAGFVLADYSVEGSQAYSLLYRSPKAQCFAIEYSRQILPVDASGLAVELFDFPAFGSAQAFYHIPPNQNEQTGPLFSQWLSNDDGSYRFVGAEEIAQNYPAQRTCQNVSLGEAVKIITSIADLNASTTTK